MAKAKVKVALLGCGGFMGVHANRLKGNADVQIVALCDEKLEQTAGFAAKNLAEYSPAPKQFTDPAKMYADTKPDAVFIATPHTLHFKHAVQALKAGCHVYMEKPMVTNAQDARALAKKVKAAGKILVVGYNTPCSPEFKFIRDTIRNGSLGRLELVMGYLSQGWKKATVGLWRQVPALSGGGQAYDSGAHLFNSLVWSVESDIESVFSFVDNAGTPVDINSSTNIKFKNGVMASIVIGGNCPGGGSFMTFIFDGGRIDVDGWGAAWIKVFKDGNEVKDLKLEGQKQTPDDNFIDAILGRAEPRTSPANGIIQSDLMDAIYESAKTGKPAQPKGRAKKPVKKAVKKAPKSKK